MVSVRIMKLLEKFEAVARKRRLADNTINAYRAWIQQFLRFSATARGQWTRPEELGTTDVESFLNDIVPPRHEQARDLGHQPAGQSQGMSRQGTESGTVRAGAQ
jgi:site-specific recombinase XerD